jgi:hypothetical protein
MTPVKDDIYYVVDEKKTEERGNKKHWAHPYYNKVITSKFCCSQGTISAQI